MAREHRAAEYVALRRGDGVEWDELMAWLGAQEREVAILEFHCLERATVVFTVRRGDRQPRHEVVPLGREDLDEILRNVFFEVFRSSPRSLRTETWKRPAAALLEGAVERLAGTDLLYLIPHAQLHHLPLHAVESGGRALVERTAVVYAPSATVARRLAPTRVDEQDARRWSGEDALVVGDPLGDRPFAAEEARLVAASLRTSALIGAAATKHAFAARLERARIAHVASHAFFDDEDPLASGLVLAEGEPDGVLRARELMDRPLAAQLLVLSGCETGRQYVRPGDELVGLARALLHAGVPSLVLSLWEVNDAASSQLMLAFYRELGDPSKGRPTLADALRIAMLELRSAHSHTYMWGAFVLAGRWR
jgi:CHAT domain-containing protein